MNFLHEKKSSVDEWSPKKKNLISVKPEQKLTYPQMICF